VTRSLNTRVIRVTGKTRTGEPGRGGWCTLPWPVNASQAYDCFPAAASLALCDVRIDRLGPVHDGLIHVPLADQQALFPRIRSWLRPGGYLLAITGAQHWTGTEPHHGATMFWDHADTATYLDWLIAARLTPIWHRYIPEGTSGHSLILARAS
jgi:hypothetical protein